MIEKGGVAVMTYLVNEEHTRHQLGNTLVNVLVYDLVDLSPQLVGDFRLSWLHELTHHAHDILATLRSSVGDIEIVQSDILHNLLLLVDFTLGHRHVLLSLEVEFSGKSITTTDALDGSGIGLDVDDIADPDALFLNGLVDTRVQPQLFRSSCRA